MRQRYRQLKPLLISLGCFSLSFNVFAFSSVDLFNATLKGNSKCLHYKVEGMCIWKEGEVPHVKYSSTLYVSHYLPDVVVNVYRKPDQDPYDAGAMIDTAVLSAINPMLKSLTDGVAMGGGESHGASYNDLNAKMKDITIMPNPGIAFFNAFSTFYIPSLASLAVPVYYDSLADIVMWKSGLAELNVAAFVDQVSSMVGDWGNMYPQQGIIDTANNYTDSAIDAMRAAGLIDEGGSYEGSAGRMIPHKLPYQCTKGNCHASHIVTGSDDTKWQLVYPKVSNGCVRFGATDVSAIVAGTDNVPSDISEGNMSWLLWRKYEGCIPHAGKLVTTIKL